MILVRRAAVGALLGIGFLLLSMLDTGRAYWMASVTGVEELKYITLGEITFGLSKPILWIWEAYFNKQEIPPLSTSVSWRCIGCC